jgi:hypothetical protein
MGFQFAETMAGTIEWADQPGVTDPFKFEVTAQAESTRDHLRDGRALLRGVVTSPPRITSADAEGVITIRLFGEKIIRYELSFLADDGTAYELVGQKDLRYLSPFKSFTHLPADILDEDHRRVATCTTTFDLRHDFWSFLRSFRSL